MKQKLVLLLLLVGTLFALPCLAVEFTDAMGRPVTVEDPQRVVSLYHSYGDAWLLSGGTLAGSISDGLDAPQDSAIVNLGRHNAPDMELLFSLEPDFVLLSKSVSAHLEISKTLEAAGIPCAFFYTPDWRSYMESIRLFTQITGRDDLYQAQREAVAEPIEALIAQARQNADHFGKTTALLVRADSSNVKAKDSEANVAGHVLRDMGFVNLADGESIFRENLSLEKILIENPEYIFVYTGGSSTEAAMQSLERVLTGNPAWNTLSAVREGRLVFLDRELFHYHPNDRWAQSYAFILSLIEGEAP